MRLALPSSLMIPLSVPLQVHLVAHHRQAVVHFGRPRPDETLDDMTRRASDTVSTHPHVDGSAGLDLGGSCTLKSLMNTSNRWWRGAYRSGPT